MLIPFQRFGHHPLRSDLREADALLFVALSYELMAYMADMFYDNYSGTLDGIVLYQK